MTVLLCLSAGAALLGYARARVFKRDRLALLTSWGGFVLFVACGLTMLLLAVPPDVRLYIGWLSVLVFSFQLVRFAVFFSKVDLNGEISARPESQ
jgi:hypothetical protein